VFSAWGFSLHAATRIAGLYEFAPQEEGDEAEEAAVAENGQAPELELAEA